MAAVPSVAWLNDGSAVILDERRPEAERTPERVNLLAFWKQEL